MDQRTPWRLKRGGSRRGLVGQETNQPSPEKYPDELGERAIRVVTEDGQHVIAHVAVRPA